MIKDTQDENADENYVGPEFKPNLLSPQDLKPIAAAARPKPWLFYIIAILLLAFIVNYSVKFYTLIKWSRGQTNVDPVTLKPRKTGLFETIRNFFDSTPDMTGGTERINILLLGIGGPGHDGAYLSDTNIILSVKPAEKKAALISIPRDLTVKMDGYGYRKINEANAYGEIKQTGAGGEYARQIFEQTFGMTIPYYARVDFQAFVDLVDAVGGVDVNVPRAFTDYSYPGPNYSYQTISFADGWQHLDGARALVYARSRHGSNGEGSDFARARRQQTAISALKEKFLSAGTLLNPVRLQKIIDSLTTHISTNLSFAQIKYLADLSKEIGDDSVKTLVLDDSPGGFLGTTISEEGAFLLVPRTGNFTAINSAIWNVFESTSTARLASETRAASAAAKPLFLMVKVEIQNGTWRAGYAAKIKQELADKGYNISGIGNSVKRPVATSTIYILNKKADKKTISDLANTMNLPVTVILPEWLAYSYDDPATSASEAGAKYRADTDILIVLGEQ
ncbi:LytR family transcriptional regulator [Patescibacteria group bacterium]|nr:MAG: LytR family transcriptional regulator [Patescibacteria group bacterium]